MNSSALRLMPRAFDRVYARYARLPSHRGQTRILNLLQRFLPQNRLLAMTRFGLMRLDARDCVQHAILVKGAYEPGTVQLVAGLLKRGGSFVDIGAHVGQFSLLASGTVGASGRVLAVEPNPQTFSDLLYNLALNHAQNVLPVLCAISEDSDLLRFGFPPEENRGASRESSLAEEPGYLVGGFSLPQCFSAAGVAAVDVLKIDVEGSEFRVLKGLFESTGIRPTSIVFEFLPDDFSYGVSPSEMLGYLARNGYSLQTIVGKPFSLGDILPENNVLATRTLAVTVS